MIRFNSLIIDKKAMTIAVDSHVRRFNRQAEGNKIFEIVCFLLLGGWTKREALFDFLYKEDLEGGPLTGHHIIDQWLHKQRLQLEHLGLVVVREKRGGDVWYKIASGIDQ